MESIWTSNLGLFVMGENDDYRNRGLPKGRKNGPPPYSRVYAYARMHMHTREERGQVPFEWHWVRTADLYQNQHIAKQ
jgi:hypothetical protein